MSCALNGPRPTSSVIAVAPIRSEGYRRDSSRPTGCWRRSARAPTLAPRRPPSQTSVPHTAPAAGAHQDNWPYNPASATAATTNAITLRAHKNRRLRGLGKVGRSTAVAPASAGEALRLARCGEHHVVWVAEQQIPRANLVR
jgi:hypothetical protein